MRALPTTLLTLALIGASAVSAGAQPAAKAPRPAGAGGGGAMADVRCLLTMVALRGQKDQQVANQGQLGVFYYAGRLAVRSANFDLASAIKTQAASLSPPQLQAELQRCGPPIQSSMQGIQSALMALRPAGAPPAGAPSAAPPPAATAPGAPAPPAPK